MNLKNPDLDLICRAHPECEFYGFMICFWNCPQKRTIVFFFLDSEIRIWIFPKKRTLYVDGRCYSHTQFPRSPLETPGTMDPPGYTGHQIRRKQKRLAFLDSRSCEALLKKACILRLSLPLKLKKKRACIFRLSLLRNLNKKNGLHFQTLAPTEAQ